MEREAIAEKLYAELGLKPDPSLDPTHPTMQLWNALVDTRLELDRLRAEISRDLEDNPRMFCPDCSADLGNFYSNRVHMVRDKTPEQMNGAQLRKVNDGR